MSGNDRPPELLFPKTLTEALNMRAAYPSSIIYAGGTFLLKKYRNGGWPDVPYIIYIGKLKELNYITRTERYIEFGALAPINRILQIGKNLLPEAFFRALSGIGTKPVRNMATIGGNICVPSRRMSLFPVLLLMDAKLELRKSGKSRWISVQKFIDTKGAPGIDEEEILTRIRLPFGSWTNQVFLALGKGRLPPKEELLFCGLCNVEKRSITDFRFAFGKNGPSVFRNMEIESAFSGASIPLHQKTLSIIDSALENNDTYKSRFTLFQQLRIKKILYWFMQTLQ